MQPRERKVLHYLLGGKDIYAEWLDGILDSVARIAVFQRVGRMEEGNFGDHRPVGNGVWELRIHCGPGYRVYYGEDGPVIVILLCGGEKKSQNKDIRLARRFWRDYRS